MDMDEPRKLEVWKDGWVRMRTLRTLPACHLTQSFQAANDSTPSRHIPRWTSSSSTTYDSRR
ncbi:hypothetical protein PROAA_870004 [Candidatus Propionivibrio aalborgensis]|uniref:Uncharacterized protein n=1 Tax=Candidatus Propionivibrio aalborgensis TaxID=1860101 RepID=A0A1A8Y2B5_9RHOO|nr:hypothetical protein PROAA_870004 [Candidatus Propionivibrio aalborgensis]